MHVREVIIVSTISWMLRAVAAIVIIIQCVRWWSWARLCCVWKLPNLSYRPVSALKNTTAWKYIKIRSTRCGKSRFYLELAKKEKVRNHSYHQFYLVLAKIRINRIRISWRLLYVVNAFHIYKNYCGNSGRAVIWDFSSHEKVLSRKSRFVFVGAALLRLGSIQKNNSFVLDSLCCNPDFYSYNPPEKWIRYSLVRTLLQKPNVPFCLDLKWQRSRHHHGLQSVTNFGTLNCISFA